MRGSNCPITKRLWPPCLRAVLYNVKEWLEYKLSLTYKMMRWKKGLLSLIIIIINIIVKVFHYTFSLYLTYINTCENGTKLWFWSNFYHQYDENCFVCVLKLIYLDRCHLMSKLKWCIFCFSICLYMYTWFDLVSKWISFEMSLVKLKTNIENELNF